MQLKINLLLMIQLMKLSKKEKKLVVLKPLSKTLILNNYKIFKTKKHKRPQEILVYIKALTMLQKN